MYKLWLESSVEAVVWTGSNFDELDKFAGDSFEPIYGDESILGYSARVYNAWTGSWETLRSGDVVLKNISGNFYPMAYSTFFRLYDAV